jgi:hypothetical protein
MPAVRKPDPVQTELPVTPAVEQPIFNSPYYEPEEHWVYGKDGKASQACLCLKTPFQFNIITGREL